MAKRFLWLAAVVPALLLAPAARSGAAAGEVGDDFLRDEGLVSAADAGAEKTPPNPTASEGLEAREGWCLAAWEDPGALAKLPDPNKAGNTLLRLATGGGRMGKSGAVLGNTMLPADSGAMTVEAFNPGAGPVKVALGFFLFDERYFETSPQVLPPGQWRTLRFDLGAPDFKCAASKWLHTTKLPARMPMRRTCLLLFGEGRKAAVFYDGVRMDCLQVPELKAGAVVQLGGDQARGALAGTIVSASSQELAVLDAAPTGAAGREVTLRARHGGSGEDHWRQEFFDRAVFRQLMPGDQVQVGWIDLKGERRVAWLGLVRQFPRTGRIAGKVARADAARGSLEVELAAAPAGFEPVAGRKLALVLPPAEGTEAKAELAGALKRLRPGAQVEVEYEHSAEYGVLIRSLKAAGAEPAPPAAKAPEPPKPPRAKPHPEPPKPPPPDDDY